MPKETTQPGPIEEKLVKARDPQTPADELIALSYEGTALRRAVAQNPSTPPRFLDTLRQHRDPLTRRLVAKNPNTPPEILLELAHYYAESLLENPALPLLLLEHPGFLLNMRRDIIQLIAMSPCSPEFPIHLFTQHPDKVIRAAAALNPSLSEAELTSLAADSAFSVRASVAQNPSLPSHLLERLGQDRDYDVRAKAAAHPDAPVALLRTLATDESQYVKASVAQNPSTPPEVLASLAKSVFEAVRVAVARNESTTLETLEALLQDKDRVVKIEAKRSLRYRQRQAQTPRTRKKKSTPDEA